MFETVIFDWDGTLVDSKDAILASFHEALAEVAQVAVPDSFIERRIGVGAAWTFKEILNAKRIAYDEKLITRLVDVKIKVAIENSDKVRLFPGSKELLESLYGKVKIGLASMNNRDVVTHLLKKFALEKFFSTVVTVEEVRNSKPAPEIFLKTAQRLCSRPEDCVVIEDSIFGVNAAKAAKMGCVAVTQGAYNVDELAKANPDLIVASIQKNQIILRFILN